MAEILRTDLDAVGAAAHPIGVALTPVLRIAIGCGHVLPLIRHVGQRQTGLYVIEGRLDAVRTQHRVGFDRPHLTGYDVGVIGNRWHDIQAGRVDEVDLAVAQPAIATVASGMMMNSTRSTFTSFPPEKPLAGSLRAT